MAKKREKNYTCTVTYTEGCEKRLTEALVDVYYNRLAGIMPPVPVETKDTPDETA
ncbi:MAG: hypothetical protein K2H85_08835 [Allobaculum sp.]|nr:hypothetical protein [Allobaculum sp.]